MSKLEIAFCTIGSDGNVITLANGFRCHWNPFASEDMFLPSIRIYILTVKTWHKLIGIINGEVQS